MSSTATTVGDTTFYLALDEAYGDKSTFKQLVNACHEHGIAVLLDVVLNHAGANPFLKMYWNASSFQPATATRGSMKFRQSETWFFDWNHDSHYEVFYETRLEILG